MRLPLRSTEGLNRIWKVRACLCNIFSRILEAWLQQAAVLHSYAAGILNLWTHAQAATLVLPKLNSALLALHATDQRLH